MTVPEKRPSYQSCFVFLSGCVVVCIFTGSFKANGVLISDAVSQYESSFTLAGGAYVTQFALAFMFAGVGGSVLDAFSYRFLGVCGGILFGLGFTCQGIFGIKLWHLFVNMVLTAVGGGLLHFAYYMSFVEHFGEKFSVALSSREIGTYVGVASMPPLMEVLRSTYGLQGSYLVLGAIAWNCIVCGLLLNSPKGRSHTRPLVEQLKCLYCTINCCHLEDTLPPSSKGNFAGDRKGKFRKFVKLFSLAPVIAHPRFAIFLVIHSLLYYTLAAWALYLVPFGVSTGLSQTAAVYLSTAGGFGGFLGKMFAIAVFYLDKMNILLAGVFPSVLCSIGLTGYTLTTDYIWLLIFSSLCGFSIAFADSALSAMVPLFVCEHHLKQGSALSYFFGGVCMQLGGIVSGAILDLLTSFSYVYEAMIAINVIICILSLALCWTFINDFREEQAREKHVNIFEVISNCLRAMGGNNSLCKCKG